jgi:hypothetical protein
MEKSDNNTKHKEKISENELKIITEDIQKNKHDQPNLIKLLKLLQRK